MDQTRFASLWDRHASGAPSGDTVYQELANSYSHPTRHYHGLPHIHACLEHFDIVREHLDNPDAVEMALWFHDVVYDPCRTDNERKSAELFEIHTGNGIESTFVGQVTNLIMMTVYPSNPLSADEKFMVDIDLSSFALPWNDFIRLGRLVRDEFGHLTDREFEQGELEFFRMLSNREYFFYTEFFRSRYENTAQSNLDRKIKQLEARNA